jgi:hypothetical protein
MTDIRTLFCPAPAASNRSDWNPSESEPLKWRQFSDDQLRDLLHKRDGFPLDVLRLTRRPGLIEALESEAA